MSDALRTWRAYADCWSTPRRSREEAMRRCLTDDVRYRDRSTSAEGIAALGDYMQRFCDAFPGARFVIDRVDEHHMHSLAQWRQIALDESVQLRGASFAVHGSGDRLQEITGFFFDTPPDPEMDP